MIPFPLFSRWRHNRSLRGFWVGLKIVVKKKWLSSWSSFWRLAKDLLEFFLFFLVYLWGKVWSLPARLLNFYFLTVNSLSALKFRFTAKLIWGRGRLFRPLSHLGIISLALVTIVSGGLLSGTPLVRRAEGFVPPDYLSYSDVLESYVSPETQIPSDRPRSEAIEYLVVSGDSLSSIGQSFKISVDAIRYANNLSDDDRLSPGEKLIIPPVEGVIYTVKKGDTLLTIARKFKVSVQAVAEFNYIFDASELAAGQKIVVPEAEIPPPPSKFIPPPLASRSRLSPIPLTAYREPGSPGGVEGSTGSFGWPLNTRTITQYFTRYHLGIDIDGSTGDPVFASDGGIVLRAGWWLGGFGNAAKIDHGNGFTTTYGHLNQINVSVGQVVNKGQVVGSVGNTGRSFGSHLHFVVQRSGQYLNPLDAF